MKWILDACTLIYLVKAQLFNDFMGLISEPLVIDSSVYDEVVVQGKKNKYSDAFEAERYLNQYQIPIISVDISSEIHRFKDPGETSCYIIARQEGICLTSDDRAYKKFQFQNIEVMKLDYYYFLSCIQEKISEEELFSTLENLEKVNATHPKTILFFHKQLKKMRNTK